MTPSGAFKRRSGQQIEGCGSQVSGLRPELRCASHLPVGLKLAKILCGQANMCWAVALGLEAYIQPLESIS